MRLLVNLFREVTKWDRPSQIALVIALILLVIDLIILSTQETLRTPALVGAIGLILAIQGIFLWGNRNLVTPYTQAQRHFINGEFEQVIVVLKDYIETEDHPIIDALVLLGNAYRTVGQLVESESVLRIAVARRKDFHFALYGLGKTLLAKGNYDGALEYLNQALLNGGSKTINFDIALALYLQGNLQDSVEYIHKIPSIEEPYRNLFIAYILEQIGENSNTYQVDEIGLIFWQAEAERFQQTPYGQAIAQDVRQIEKIL